jgi:hypothetical protein
MPRKHTNSYLLQKKYTDTQLQDHIKNQVDNVQFNRHCNEVSQNLGIDVVIVKDLLLNNSFTVLSLIQKCVLKNKAVKINITGYFSFVTVLMKYKYSHLFKITKGRSY